jgi:hypothetical protein
MPQDSCYQTLLRWFLRFNSGYSKEEKMFKNQKGFFPVISKVLGLIIFAYPTFIVLVNTIHDVYSNFTLSDTILRLIADMIVLVIPIWVSQFLLSLFPSIKITEQGVKYLSFPIRTNLIKWDEIDSIVRFRNGYAAVVFNKKGFIILNGLYYNKIYGMIIKAFDPVIFLSSNILNQTELLEKLKEMRISGIGNKLV